MRATPTDMRNPKYIRIVTRLKLIDHDMLARCMSGVTIEWLYAILFWALH